MVSTRRSAARNKSKTSGTALPAAATAGPMPSEEALESAVGGSASASASAPASAAPTRAPRQRSRRTNVNRGVPASAAAGGTTPPRNSANSTSARTPARPVPGQEEEEEDVDVDVDGGEEDEEEEEEEGRGRHNRKELKFPQGGAMARALLDPAVNTGLVSFRNVCKVHEGILAGVSTKAERKSVSRAWRLYRNDPTTLAVARAMVTAELQKKAAEGVPVGELEPTLLAAAVGAGFVVLAGQMAACSYAAPAGLAGAAAGAAATAGPTPPGTAAAAGAGAGAGAGNRGHGDPPRPAPFSMDGGGNLDADRSAGHGAVPPAPSTNANANTDPSAPALIAIAEAATGALKAVNRQGNEAQQRQDQQNEVNALLQGEIGMTAKAVQSTLCVAKNAQATADQALDRLDRHQHEHDEHDLRHDKEDKEREATAAQLAALEEKVNLLTTQGKRCHEDGKLPALSASAADIAAEPDDSSVDDTSSSPRRNLFDGRGSGKVDGADDSEGGGWEGGYDTALEEEEEADSNDGIDGNEEEEDVDSVSLVNEKSDGGGNGGAESSLFQRGLVGVIKGQTMLTDQFASMKDNVSDQGTATRVLGLAVDANSSDIAAGGHRQDRLEDVQREHGEELERIKNKIFNE